MALELLVVIRSVSLAACSTAPRRGVLVLVAASLALRVWCDPPVLLAQQPADRTVEADVRMMLQQYAEALEALDATVVRKFQPSINVELLRKAFREMRALDVVIDEVRVLSTDGAIVRAGCRVTQTLTPRAGSKQTTSVTRVMRLRKQDSAWVIDSFER